jgi:nicotinate phosphoribosyltransferase
MLSPQAARADDPGLLTPEQTALLIDQYELAMATSYLERGMNEVAIFELSVRELPPTRDWLLFAGLGPALRLVTEMRFAQDQLAYLESIGFRTPLLDYLARFRFRGDIDAVPEGTVVFAGEPLVRVCAPRIDAQLLETLLLNQINFQTAIATKAARLVLAAGSGETGAGERVVDFSARRDHGVDAAMKAARSAAIAGVRSTSNVAAAMRYGLQAVGTMAHSYVLSFAHEQGAFEAFMRDMPTNTIMLVDTYDTLEGVRRAIAASRSTGVPLDGVRMDSGDLLTLSRAGRELLDGAGMRNAIIVASGDLEEHQIARLVAAGAPIDLWGVGTELGVSRDAPALGGVYKLVADRDRGGAWRSVSKRSPAKGTIPGAKQLFRAFKDGGMAGDLVVEASEEPPAVAVADAAQERRALLERFVEGGEITRAEPLTELRARARENLAALPPELRSAAGRAPRYPVSYSERLLANAELASAPHGGAPAR